jgi:hypothetical protein
MIKLPNLSKGASVYVCGPMTGIHCYNFPQFFYWATVLELSGYKALNPAEIDLVKMFEGWRYSEDQWEEVLAADLELIQNDAQALFVLKGWQDSKGANLEIDKAKELGLAIFFEEELA